MLRITRKSNDWVTWLTLPLSLAWLVVPVIFTAGLWRLVGLTNLLTWTCLAISICMLAGSLVLFRRLVAPFEFEFVLDETGLRYGRTDRPKSQRVVSRSQVREFLYDPDDGSLSMFVGDRTIAPGLAPDILLTKASMQKVVDAVREHWPEVKIVLFGAQPAAN